MSNPVLGNLYGNQIPGISLALLALPALFVTANLLEYGLGVGVLFDPMEALLSDPGVERAFNVVSPFAFLGGLLGGLALNLYVVTGLSLRLKDRAVIATVSVELRFWNRAVLALSALVLTIMVGYVILENISHALA